MDEYTEEEQLYYRVRQDEDGKAVIEGYAYGPDWVAMAMYMDDLLFDTPEEAKAWWEKEKKNG